MRTCSSSLKLACPLEAHAHLLLRAVGAQQSQPRHASGSRAQAGWLPPVAGRRRDAWWCACFSPDCAARPLLRARHAPLTHDTSQGMRVCNHRHQRANGQWHRDCRLHRGAKEPTEPTACSRSKAPCFKLTLKNPPPGAGVCDQKLHDGRGSPLWILPADMHVPPVPRSWM